MKVRELFGNDLISYDWDNFVEHSPQGNIFCKSWWLKSVNVEKVLVCIDKDRIVGGIPLFYKKKLGINFSMVSTLTQTWGVLFEPMESKEARASARKLKIQNCLINELSKQRFFMQSFSVNYDNWLAFFWAGYKQTTRYTYIINNTKNSDEVWSNFLPNVRKNIRKAERLGVNIQVCSPEIALELFQKTQDRQGRKMSYSSEYFMSLYNVTKSNQSGECYAAIDEKGRVHAATFFVWDSKRAYYLIGGGDPELRNSGAASLLIFELIKLAGIKGKIFDFEGSMVPAIEKFFRAFGATPMPYYFITRMPTFMRAILVATGRL